MEELAPCLGYWEGAFEVDPAQALDCFIARYNDQREMSWNPDPDYLGRTAEHERFGPIRVGSFHYPGGWADSKEDEFAVYIQQQLMKCLIEYLDAYPCAINDIQWQESNRLLYYYPGASLGPHSDNTVSSHHDQLEVAQTRTLAVTMALNGHSENEEPGEHEYIGGEFHFPYFDISYIPRKGSIFIYPANFAYSHYVDPIEAGYRLINLTCFCQGKLLGESFPGGNMPITFGKHNNEVGWL